jgi:hypothetical protein
MPKDRVQFKHYKLMIENVCKKFDRWKMHNLSPRRMRGTSFFSNTSDVFILDEGAIVISLNYILYSIRVLF